MDTDDNAACVLRAHSTGPPMIPPSRRRFLQVLAASGAALPSGAHAFGRAPAIIRRDAAVPTVDYGVAAGDVGIDRAIVWAHVDRPARMLVEWSTTDRFERVRRVRGPLA